MSLLTRIRYTSIRIDAVHYCELEEFLSSKRRHDNLDISMIRLHLLPNTLRQNRWLGSLVQFLKLPYMTREFHKSHLARAVADCPNLRHVDLPDSFFSGDPDCNLLRQELLTHCPDLRSMKYHARSEQFFQQLAQRQWQAIETLELRKLSVDTLTLRTVLAFLPLLLELSLKSLPNLTDEIYTNLPQLPPFPRLRMLGISGCKGLTTTGITRYLKNCEMLSSLSLEHTAITVPELAAVLDSASNLKNFVYVQTVSSELPVEQLPPLRSLTLQILHYEISPSDTSLPINPYHDYLAQSLFANGLPSLHTVHLSSWTCQQPLLALSHPLQIHTTSTNDDTKLFCQAFSPQPSSATDRLVLAHRRVRNGREQRIDLWR